LDLKLLLGFAGNRARMFSSRNNLGHNYA